MDWTTEILYPNFNELLKKQKIFDKLVDVNNLKNGRKPVKLQKENPAGCAGEGKLSKGN